MKLLHKIVIALVIIMLVVGGTLWWMLYREPSKEQHELSKGQLVIIGDTNSGRSIYLLDPLLRSWRRLPTNDLFPWRMAWSPDGKKIAFTYSTSSADDEAVTGIAMLNLENMETEKLYVAPSNEDLDNLAWTPDGQSLVFDIHENYFLTAFQKLVILTGKLQSISVPENTLPKYFGAEHLEIDQNNDYIIEGSGGYIASPDLKNFRMFTPNTVEDLGGFFLTPDRKEITTFCGQAALCNYNIDTNKLTEAYNGKLTSECCAVTDGNWSYDEKDVVYLVSGGESDPQYIILLDTQTKQNYTIYKFYYKAIELGPVDVRQLTWYSAK